MWPEMATDPVAQVADLRLTIGKIGNVKVYTSKFRWKASGKPSPLSVRSIPKRTDANSMR